MKYICFWEFKPEDMDKVIEKVKKLAEEKEKNPEKYTKHLFPPHSMGHCKGFTIVEASPTQLANTIMFDFPEFKLKYEPIYNAAEMTELYLKSKKT